MSDENNEELVKSILDQMNQIGYVPRSYISKAVRAYLGGGSLNLYGQFGGGKSIFWKVLSQIKMKHAISGSVVRPFYFAVIPMARVAAFTLQDIRKWLWKYEDWELVVDDLGAEPLHVSYGMRSEVINLILSMRESSSKRTHFTTNIQLTSAVSENTIEKRYGKRISDRISYAKTIQFGENVSHRGVGRFRLPMSDEENYRILELAQGEAVERAERPDSAKPRFRLED